MIVSEIGNKIIAGNFDFFFLKYNIIDVIKTTPPNPKTIHLIECSPIQASKYGTIKIETSVDTKTKNAAIIQYIILLFITYKNLKGR